MKPARKTINRRWLRGYSTNDGFWWKLGPLEVDYHRGVGIAFTVVFERV